VECFWNKIFIILTTRFCKGDGEVVPVHIMKAYGGVEVQVLILNSSLGAGEWSASHPSHFTPGKEPPLPIE
jgi:hypothetical protein